jgi:hypothetical protein
MGQAGSGRPEQTVVDSVSASLRDLPPLVVIDIAGEITVSAAESATEAYQLPATAARGIFCSTWLGSDT